MRKIGEKIGCMLISVFTSVVMVFAVPRECLSIQNHTNRIPWILLKRAKRAKLMIQFLKIGANRIFFFEVVLISVLLASVDLGFHVKGKW